MFEFLRLLEARSTNSLLLEMTPGEAKQVFTRYGGTNADISPAGLRKTWISLVQKYHPDRPGGSNEILSQINAAHDVLKGGVAPGTSSASTSSSSKDRRPPEWQTDPRSAYNGWSKEDYRDINWFKKRMWELSNHSQQRWTIYGHDGRFFRGMVTVFGSYEIFRQMAEAMVIWNGKQHTRAVFVQEGDDQGISLIWIDGRHMKPVYMDFESPNNNPSNDKELVRSLPLTLDQISKGVDVTV